jgi:hypothetical protein
LLKNVPAKSESSAWKSSRCSAALAVLALHLAVVGLLLMRTRSPPGIPTSAPAVEVMFLPPVKVPTARADGAHLQQMKVDVGMSLAPPTVDSSAQAASAGGSHGGTPGINWAAEAHRAVEAFEIRRDQQVTHATVGLSLWDGWLARQPHHAGEQMRTDSGDWIVWIDSNCYQVAHWHPGAPQNADPPTTTCLGTGSGSDTAAAEGENLPPKK